MPRSRSQFAVSAMLATLAVVACRRQAERSGAAVPDTAPLPELALSPEKAASVTRIALTRPDDANAAQPSTIVLERRGTSWVLTAPLHAPASADKVMALLANLQDLRVWKRLDPGTAFYDRYDLTEGKGLHVLVQIGEGRAGVEFFAGKSSEQGQLIRLPGTPGLFALVNWGPHGYQGFLYARDLRSWRDPNLWGFDEADVEAVEIVNPHGAFSFTRQGATWVGALARRRKDGKVGPRRPWPHFDPSRVEELLRVYHALAGDDFGDAQDRADAGVEQAERTGGIVRLRLRERSPVLVLRVGGPAATNSRFSIPGSRWATTGEAGGAADEPLYALSPWTARWATADPSLFEARGHL